MMRMMPKNIFAPCRSKSAASARARQTRLRFPIEEMPHQGAEDHRGIIILISAMKPSPIGFTATAIGIGIANEEVERDRDQDLDAEDLVPGLMLAEDGWLDRDVCRIVGSETYRCLICMM